MAEFISKLQYKTYEKGEFSDEKARSLEETLKLIRDFPWDEQRGVDIQLTGPSVTIQNEYVEYLKLALFFNGKFCLYLYDRNDHLFELHEPALEDACLVITDFFNNLPIEDKFDKHLFSIGSKSHFQTASFEYRVNNISFFLYFFLMLCFSLIALSGTFAFSMMKNDAPKVLLLIYLLLDFVCLQSFYFLVKTYWKSKDMYLHISSGNDVFEFGINDDVKVYRKTDIAKINLYGASSRSSKIFKIMDVIFKDGSKITFSGYLIDPYTLILKFPFFNFNYINKTSAIWKMIWNFSK